MLLRSSIASTRKFFQKTMHNFKSFFSAGYQKLPKTSHHNQFSYSLAAATVMDMNDNPSYKDLEKFYADFTHQWDSEKEKQRRRSKKKTILSSPKKQEMEVYNGSFISLSTASPVQKKNQVEEREEYNNQSNKKIITQQTGKKQDSSLSSMGMSEQRNCMVEKKLRELEMLDMGNVDYAMDIEEVLHYYSRLTCPAYLEIVDKFFMEMSSELFGPAPPATARSVKSRSLKLRSVRSQACFLPGF